MKRNCRKQTPIYFCSSMRGMTLIEVMIAVIIAGTSFFAIYGAVLWGKYRATQSQYVVAASDIGRHQIELIKGIGIINSTSSDYNKPGVSSTLFNNSLGYGGTFTRTNGYSLDTLYDVEAKYTDDSSVGASKVIRVFTVNVYLHPTNFPTDTAVAPYKDPLASYVTYITQGGI